MTSELDPTKVTQLLTQSTLQLNEATLSALANARRDALKRQSAHTPVFALTTGRWTTGWWTQSRIPHATQQWLVAGLLAAIFVIVTGYWHHTQEQQISELDVAILTDDLPIEVFID